MCRLWKLKKKEHMISNTVNEQCFRAPPTYFRVNCQGSSCPFQGNWAPLCSPHNSNSASEYNTLKCITLLFNTFTWTVTCNTVEFMKYYIDFSKIKASTVSEQYCSFTVSQCLVLHSFNYYQLQWPLKEWKGFFWLNKRFILISQNIMSYIMFKNHR